MSNTKRTTIGFLTAIFIFFLGTLIHNQLQAPDGDLGESLIIFAAIAVPGGLLAAWLSGAFRRSS